MIESDFFVGESHKFFSGNILKNLCQTFLCFCKFDTTNFCKLGPDALCDSCMWMLLYVTADFCQS